MLAPSGEGNESSVVTGSLPELGWPCALGRSKRKAVRVGYGSSFRTTRSLGVNVGPLANEKNGERALPLQ